MKTHILSVLGFATASIALWHMPLHGQGQGESQEKNARESTLLEKLKDYIQDNDIRAEETIRELSEFGSTNVVQFFLDNIGWRHQPQYSTVMEALLATTDSKAIHIIEDYPMAKALLNMKDVPLRQCVDAYMKTSGIWNNIEHLAKQIHGDEFLQAVESLDAKRGADMRMRWHEPEKWREGERIRREREAWAALASETEQPGAGESSTDAIARPDHDTPSADPPADAIAEEAKRVHLWLPLAIGGLLCLCAVAYVARKGRNA